MINVSINGAGRIGLIFLRLMANRINSGEITNINLCLINDPFATLEDIKYRFIYDSAHGQFKDKVEICEKSKTLKIGEKVNLTFCSEKDPKQIPYGKFGIKIVVECSGVFTEYDKAIQHVFDTVKHVVISAPAKHSRDGSKTIKTLVYGVNHEEFNTSHHTIVSNASCTTNCLAPLIHVLKSSFGNINYGYITTTHASTATQKVVDSASAKDLASGRSALCNIIPASTGAARAIGEVFPDLASKLDGYALRVPTLDVSVTDYVIGVENTVSVDKVRKAFQDYASAAAGAGSSGGILGIAHSSAVSSDFLGSTKSCVVDMDRIMVDEKHRVVKGLAFYDNEVGYSSRLGDLTLFIASKL